MSTQLDLPPGGGLRIWTFPAHRTALTLSELANGDPVGGTQLAE